MTMQAKDIPDAIFLDAVRQTPGVDGTTRDVAWRLRWRVHDTLDRLLGWPVPENLLLAKARKLMRRGLLGGCDCGCRGDYHIPTARAGCCGACDLANNRAKEGRE